MGHALMMLGFGLVSGLNPLRFGLTLLVISRPRPMQNLLAYWVACLAAGITALMVPLTLLHMAPALRSLTQDLADPGTFASSVVRYVRLGIGVLALAIATLMIVRSLTRRHQREQVPTPAANASTLLLDSNPVARLLNRNDDDATTEGGSAIRRSLRRLRNAWESGSLWVSAVIGVAFGGVEPDAILIITAFTLTSGVAIGMQICGAIAFVLGILSVAEITLASYLIAPTRTHAIMQTLHDWAQTHRQKILVVMCLVGGVSLVAYFVRST